MSRVSGNKRTQAYGKRSPAYGAASPAHGSQSPAHGKGPASGGQGGEAGRYNIQDVHAFVVIVFIAVFILGLMIKIIFF